MIGPSYSDMGLFTNLSGRLRGRQHFVYLINYLHFPQLMCLLTHLSKATTTVRKMDELNKGALGASVGSSSPFTLLSTTDFANLLGNHLL